MCIKICIIRKDLLWPVGYTQRGPVPDKKGGWVGGKLQSSYEHPETKILPLGCCASQTDATQRAADSERRGRRKKMEFGLEFHSRESICRFVFRDVRSYKKCSGPSGECMTVSDGKHNLLARNEQWTELCIILAEPRGREWTFLFRDAHFWRWRCCRLRTRLADVMCLFFFFHPENAETEHFLTLGK